nr:putative oxidoreductase [Quercus suber]
MQHSGVRVLWWLGEHERPCSWMYERLIVELFVFLRNASRTPVHNSVQSLRAGNLGNPDCANIVTSLDHTHYQIVPTTRHLTMGNFFSQSFLLPAAAITERNCPSQKGRVFIVTGGYAGVGFELTRLLVAAGATVYIAGRSESKAAAAIDAIQKKANTADSGRVEFLSLDLADLSTIQPAVEQFKTRAQRLDVLVNNAGVMFPPEGSVTIQSHDLTVGTNCLGPYLLYKLLEPLLTQTAQSSPTASVRVTWAGSLALDALAPKDGGMQLEPDGRPRMLANDLMYAQSKTGNAFLAREFARRTPQNGVLHVSFNPGNLRTELQRHWEGFGAKMTDWLLLYPAINGGYTELWAAVSPDLTPDKSGAYIWPWGRVGSLRPDIEAAAKSIAEGGIGLGERFVAWCEKETAAFA